MSSLRNRQTFHSKCVYFLFQKKMNLQFTRYDMFHDADNVQFLHWRYFIQNRDHLTSIKTMDKYMYFVVQSNWGKGKYFLQWQLYEVYCDNYFLSSRIALAILNNIKFDIGICHIMLDEYMIQVSIKYTQF